MMVREEIGHTRFTQALGAILGDAGLLMRQELELAKEEFSLILSEQARGAAYFGAAALFCFVAVLGFCASAVSALVERGVRPSLACLLIAVALLVLALISIAVARSKIKAKPVRTIKSLRRDVEIAKEAFK